MLEDSSKRCAFQLGPLAGARGPGEHALLGKPAYGVFLRLLLFRTVEIAQRKHFIAFLPFNGVGEPKKL